MSMGEFNFAAHLERQRDFSLQTFGPGARAAGVVDHIRKELREIEDAPGDLAEWVDVVILALDGAWRTGATPEEIIAALVTKQTRNEGRTWPDWRTMDPDTAIEHVRAADSQSTTSAEPTERVLIGGAAYTIPAPVAIELLRLHIELRHAAQVQQDAKAQAVLDAALEWWTERSLRDWAEIRLAKAVADYDGDWPGCEGCNFECGENCMPATVTEMHTAIDHQTADLIHAGILYAYEGWTPPSDWKPSEARTRELQPKIRYVPAPQTSAARDVLAERRRQIETEGWAPSHDDAYTNYQLVLAAGCYVTHDDPDCVPPLWPFAPEWWKPTTPRRNWTKAGALILAEIERLDRAAASVAKETP